MRPNKRSAPPGNANLAGQLAGFFLYLANANNSDFLPAISELELSLTQLKALSTLDSHPEVMMSIKDLAESLGLSIAATSRAVDGLVKRGLVDRQEDSADRRVRRIALTRVGRRTVERLLAMRVATLERLLDDFSPNERERLAGALDLLLQREEISRFHPRRRAAR